MLLSALVPLYNEENTVELCVHDIQKYLRDRPFKSELILVDDGSTDQTAKIAERLIADYPEARLIRHVANAGKGAAIKTGIREANGTFIAYLDADLSTRPEAIDLALSELRDADLVFASRSHSASKIAVPQSAFRVYAGKAFNMVIRHMTGLPYRDTQCGFKVFRSGFAEQAADLASDGWAYDVELLVAARGAGLRVREIPVVWRNHAESRVRLRHAPAILSELKRIKKRITLPRRK